MTEVYTRPDQASTPRPPRLQLAEKLLRFITDPAVGEGEAQNAGAKLAGILKKDGIEFTDLIEHLASELDMDREQEPSACDVVLDFGQHAGCTLGWIARRNLHYLVWLLENMPKIRPSVRAAISIVVDHFIGTKGREEAAA